MFSPRRHPTKARLHPHTHAELLAVLSFEQAFPQKLARLTSKYGAKCPENPPRGDCFRPRRLNRFSSERSYHLTGTESYNASATLCKRFRDIFFTLFLQGKISPTGFEVKSDPVVGVDRADTLLRLFAEEDTCGEFKTLLR